jgi:hypothetical protein
MRGLTGSTGGHRSGIQSCRSERIASLPIACIHLRLRAVTFSVSCVELSNDTGHARELVATGAGQAAISRLQTVLASLRYLLAFQQTELVAHA